MNINGTRILRIRRIYAGLKTLFPVLLRKWRARKLEKRHAKGYAKHPVEKGEFDVWQEEQVWEVETRRN